MLKSYRELDTIIIEATAFVEQMLADIERTMLGKRAPQVFEEEDDGKIQETDSEGDEPEEPDDSTQDDLGSNQVAYRPPGR